MTAAPLLARDTDHVRTLTLNRPERRNALDTALGTALLEALHAADRDESVGAVLLAGAGPVFCAGADIGEFRGERADPEAMAHRSDTFLALQLAFEEIRVPVVSAVTGAAVGAGASLAIAADFTVMGDTARLSWPEVAHGMVPSLVMAHLQHRTARKHAFELLALGVPVAAHEAHASGLANRVVADAAVHDTALHLARTLAQQDRGTLRRTKGLFVSLSALSIADALRAARAAARRDQARARP